MLESALFSRNNGQRGINTVSLLHFNGEDGGTVILDSAKYGRKFTAVSGPTLSSTQSKFGGTSLYVPGTGEVSAPDEPLLRLSNAWTVEYWIYALVYDSKSFLFGKNVSSVPAKNNIRSDTSGNLWLNTNTNYTSMKYSTLKVNAWQHHALVGRNGYAYFYVDGTLVMSVPESIFGPNNAPFAIGGSPYEAGAMNAYYQEFRISKIARYTGSFTPPNQPFVLD